jgi:anti-anti-sigma regulatory factor
VSEFTILVKQEGDEATARIIGKGSFKNAKLLKNYADQVRADGAKCIMLDLQECPHMDSTFMGVIAGIAVGQKRNGAPAPKIINANPRALELLNSLGLGQILDIDPEHKSVQSGTCTELALGDEADKGDVTKTMLEAHETLVNIDKSNAAKFQDVITFLKDKLDSNPK